MRGGSGDQIRSRLAGPFESVKRGPVQRVKAEHDWLSAVSSLEHQWMAKDRMAKVLVVKYRSRSRESLVGILRHAGHDVAEANGRGKSLEKACQERPDIVLLDVSTQPQDGFEALRQLRGDTTTADVPVILLTGSAAVVGEQDAMRLGANHYLTMPWKPDMVEATIKVALSEPFIAADQTEDSPSVMRSRPHTKKRLQRADRRAGAPYAREEESLPKIKKEKAISPTGFDWQEVVKGFIVQRYGDKFGAIQSIKFRRITESGPIRGLNIYKLEGVTTMLVGNIPTLQAQGFSITVLVTRDGRIVDRQGRIL